MSHEVHMVFVCKFGTGQRKMFAISALSEHGGEGKGNPCYCRESHPDLPAHSLSLLVVEVPSS